MKEEKKIKKEQENERKREGGRERGVEKRSDKVTPSKNGFRPVINVPRNDVIN